jgi:FkbM family methyltransferase
MGGFARLNLDALWKPAVRRLLRLFGMEVFNDGAMIRLFRIDRRPWGLDPTQDLARLLGKDAITTIVDVGANEGQTAERWATTFGNATIWACEPASEPFAKLVARRLPRTKPFRVALSDAAGEAEFYTNDFSTLGSLLPIEPRFEYGRPAGTERVQTERLDEFVRRNDIRTIDVLKIDTQGSEMRVLEGAKGLLSSARVKAVLCELEFEPIYRGQASPAEI